MVRQGRFFRRRFRRIVSAIFALTLTVVLVNCGGSPNTESEAPAGTAAPADTGTLVFGSGGQPDNLSSGDVTDGDSLYVLSWPPSGPLPTMVWPGRLICARG